MLAQYPAEMTVVLQHQFWDLVVTESGFEVGVSFGGVPERLAVPFAAVKGFFDPSVQFGLQFEDMADAEAQEEAKEEAQAGAQGEAQESGQASERAPAGKDRDPARPQAEHKPMTRTSVAVPVAANPEPAGTRSDTDSDKPAGGGEVVRLDRFRKK